MGDVGDDFRAYREARKKKRANNREQSIQLLDEWNITYTRHNMGAHIVVDIPGTDGNGQVDFWPGTGLWIVRKAHKRGRGVKPLLKFLASAKNEIEPRSNPDSPKGVPDKVISGGIRGTSPKPVVTDDP
mgnify:CR=1 FL=1